MFKDEFQAVCNAGGAKINLMKKNPTGYFVSSMVAGMFISFGSFVAFVFGSIIFNGDAAYWTKAVQAFAFAAALSLVITAGAELFTGNNFVLGAAAMRKSVSWGDACKLWIFCWIGNLVGSLLSVLVFHLTKIPTGAVGEYFTQISAGKVGLGPVELLSRAVLCNILVCLAVWCSIKMKTESGKLIMVFWCIFVFMVCGFEHSVANMSIEGVALFNGGISLGEYLYSVILATVGNMVGGIVFVSLPYHLISKEK
ncbi:formate/nitrite transporter family protein [Hominifimenecus sp. rT4P-3]|uniref:formate/nitrite transporter family protein n=1 Tax=Hominifimenecus sp. rT4P-3 TaxID=3242979 RepID=UPI003DA57692